MTIYKPWKALSHYAPASNLVFANARELAARSKNGGLIVYQLANKPWEVAKKPQCCQPQHKGPILAIGNHRENLFGLILLSEGKSVTTDGFKRWNQVWEREFDVDSNSSGKSSFVPIGYPNPIPPLQFCCGENNPWFKFVTRDSDGTLAVLENLIRGHIAILGPFDVAAFGLTSVRASESRVIVVAREPNQWRVTARDQDDRSLTVDRDNETAQTAFLGFGGHIQHADFGLVALELGNAQWMVLCADGPKNYVVSEDMQVVGVTSHPKHQTPGLVLLASNKRSIVVQGYDWIHILPMSPSDIESVTVSSFASHIAYKTVHSDMFVYSLAFDAFLYELHMEGVTYHENPQWRFRTQPRQKIDRRRAADPSEHPWFGSPRFAPASNLAFAGQGEMVGRAATGTILSYLVAESPIAFGGESRRSVRRKSARRTFVLKPKIYHSWSQGEIAAVGYINNAMLGVKFPANKNVAFLETIGKKGGKIPLGYYPIQNVDMTLLPEIADPIRAWPLSPCFARHIGRVFELLTVHPSGNLVHLKDDGEMRTGLFGPEHVVAFEIYQGGRQWSSFVAYVVREPEKWVIVSIANSRKTREVVCKEEAPAMAFIGFSVLSRKMSPEIIAVPISQKQWVLIVHKYEFDIYVTPGTRVVGAIYSDYAEIPPALVILEEDRRTITLLGQKKWKHHFPPATSDIVQVKVQAHNELIVYVTKLGEVVALKSVFPDPLVLLSPRVER